MKGLIFETFTSIKQQQDKILHSVNPSKKHILLNLIPQNSGFIGITKEPVRIDSQCKYAVVARGDASIYLRLPTRPGYQKNWDHSAGVMVIEEAGGRVSDIFGKVDFSIGRTLANNKGVVVTSGKFTMMLYQPFKNLGCTIKLKYVFFFIL